MLDVLEVERLGEAQCSALNAPTLYRLRNDNSRLSIGDSVSLNFLRVYFEDIVNAIEAYELSSESRGDIHPKELNSEILMLQLYSKEHL